MSDLFKTSCPVLRTLSPWLPVLIVIGVVVSDMAASLAFYRRLGLDIPADADAEPHVEVALPGGLRARVRHRGDDPVVRRLVEAARRAAGIGSASRSRATTPADVDATYAMLTGSGSAGHLAPWDAFWGQRYAIVLDPDGNHVELFAAARS